MPRIMNRLLSAEQEALLHLTRLFPPRKEAGHEQPSTSGLTYKGTKTYLIPPDSSTDAPSSPAHNPSRPRPRTKSDLHQIIPVGWY